MNPKIATRRVALLLMLFALCTITALAQTTSFTYQGRLTDGTNAANGRYDLTFAVFNASSAGTQFGSTITNTATVVTNGIFTVTLDFGAVRYVIPSHFGFCLGVKNAIERAYETLAENPTKRVFMLSELIHNPFVNEDLLRHVAPLGWEHIGLTGDYVWSTADQPPAGTLRPLRQRQSLLAA